VAHHNDCDVTTVLTLSQLASKTKLQRYFLVRIFKVEELFISK